MSKIYGIASQQINRLYGLPLNKKTNWIDASVLTRLIKAVDVWLQMY